MPKNIKVSFSNVSGNYEIHIGANILRELGIFTRSRIHQKARQVCLISNKKVFNLYGGIGKKSLETAGFAVSVFLMPDGEKYKNLRVLEKVLAFLSAQKLTRTDAIIALGGGVVGDLAGFAAAIFQRGIDFVQVPTTFLAQIDSSVGGKTGVNTNFGKNLIGAFHQPAGVLIDVETLLTLPRRELNAGFFEAVKHAAISNFELFSKTKNFLEKIPLKNFRANFGDENFKTDLQNLIAANIAFKAEIVAGDERENVDLTGERSRRILNFGHTVGHALEKVTNYKRFKHGEAVGLGMIAAINLSKRFAKLTQNQLKLFCDVLHSVGRLPPTDDIAPESVIEAFSHDKKAIGDSFKWILLEEIGRPTIVDNRDIPESYVREAVRAALQEINSRTPISLRSK